MSWCPFPAAFHPDPLLLLLTYYPDVSLPFQHLCCSSSCLCHFHRCLACPLPPPTVLTSLRILTVCHPCKTIATSTFYATHLSCLCPACLNSSIFPAALFPSASFLLDHVSKLFAPLPSHIKRVSLPQCQHGLVMYLIMCTLFILWASDDPATRCLTD